MVFVPYLGDKLLPDLARLKAAKHGSTEGEHDPYATPLYRRIRAVITWCVTQRTLVIIVTVLLFAGSIFTFRYVPKQFFADSNRLELLLNIKLAEGASLKATQAHVEKIEALLKDRPGIENYVAYVGSGSPRFYLPLDQQLPAISFAQFVMITDSLEQREEVREWLIETMHEQFPDVHSRITRLENGPPVGYPVQFRVTGEHIGQVRELARQVAAVVRNNPHVSNVHLDWEEPSKVVYLQIDQDRARAMGVSTASVSQFLRGALSGASVGQFREGNELIEILQRGTLEDREDLAGLGSLAIPTDYGTSVSLSQVATLEYGFEDGVIWHRDRLPNVTVRADIYGKDQAVDVVREILPQLQGVRDSLPDGYLLDVGGTVEDSTRGQSSVIAGMPLFLLVVLSLLMIQLRSFSRSVMGFPYSASGVDWCDLVSTAV